MYRPPTTCAALVSRRYLSSRQLARCKRPPRRLPMYQLSNLQLSGCQVSRPQVSGRRVKTINQSSYVCRPVSCVLVSIRELLRDVCPPPRLLVPRKSKSKSPPFEPSPPPSLPSPPIPLFPSLSSLSPSPSRRLPLTRTPGLSWDPTLALDPWMKRYALLGSENLLLLQGLAHSREGRRAVRGGGRRS